jgi:hypothetical protein
MHTTPPLDEEQKLRTLKEAADYLDLPYFKIQRAARRGLIPTYSLLNSRKYVKIADIRQKMSANTSL